jgi:hypothetical protein
LATAGLALIGTIVAPTVQAAPAGSGGPAAVGDRDDQAQSRARGTDNLRNTLADKQGALKTSAVQRRLKGFKE